MIARGCLIAVGVIGVAAWLAVGHKLFVYWWTHKVDYRTEDRPVSCLVSVFGPLMGGALILVDWILENSEPSPLSKVIVPKRGS